MPCSTAAQPINKQQIALFAVFLLLEQKLIDASKERKQLHLPSLAMSSWSNGFRKIILLVVKCRQGSLIWKYSKVHKEFSDAATLISCLKLCNFPDMQRSDMPEFLSVLATEAQADVQSAIEEEDNSGYFLCIDFFSDCWLFICLLFCSWDWKKCRHVWALQIWKPICTHR